MTELAYPAARSVAATVQAYFARHQALARQKGPRKLAPEPDASAIEAIVDAAVWASLRREEQYSPKMETLLL